MGNGWHEWPLVLFTVLGQCVVGATIVSGLGWLALGDQREARRRLVRNMFFIWLLMGIAELRAKHGQLAAVAPLPSAHFTRPSIVIKPNANARPCGDTTGYLANPKEV